jgi:phosphoglycerate dehydrogenase-like enzyme
MRVYFPKPPKEDSIPILREAVGSGVEILTGDVPDDFEMVIDGRPTEAFLSVPSMRYVVVPFAGVPEQTLKLLRERPHLSGHNLHHNAADTAELALTLLFSSAKYIVPVDQRLRKDNWGSGLLDSRAMTLDGKTALILGYGQIGRRIARVLVASGMRVLALRRNALATNEEGVELHGSERLHDLLPEANVLMVALPLTSETTGLIGVKELALLPKGSILVNIARGLIVDEEPLYQALKSGHLHSAGIDVWYQYPEVKLTLAGHAPVEDEPDIQSPSKFPFRDLDNVVMSPHRGGTSMDSEPRRLRDLAAVIRAAATGEPVPNRVNLEAGY